MLIHHHFGEVEEKTLLYTICVLIVVPQIVGETETGLMLLFVSAVISVTQPLFHRKV